MFKKLNSGFTLVELLITMGIAVVLGGVAMSNYYSYQSSISIDGAAAELLGTLRDAQQRAISQDMGSAWGVYINSVLDGPDYYELFYGNSYSSGTVISRTTLSTRLRFLLPIQGATKEINFAKSTGIVSSDVAITIISEANSTLSRTIEINATSGLIGSTSGFADVPAIISINPFSGWNTGSIQISNLAGSAFQSGATVKLTKAGQSDINCTSVTFVSAQKLTATCDITNAVVGDWTVVVTNPDARVATLSSPGFLISHPGGNIAGYAWSENIGWISFNCNDSGTCGTADFGVNMDSGTGLFSGYAWSENIGWISFNTADLTGCPSGTCEARVSGSSYPKSLKGWAKVLSTGDWISLGSGDISCGEVVSHGGKSYNTVKIGSQCWFSTNLDYVINSCNTKTWVNNTDVGWCGYYTGGPFTNEGLLYQWSAAMNGSTTEGAQGACPTGWHIPTDAELYSLESYLTSPGQVCDSTRVTNYSCAGAGAALKPGGYSNFNVLLTGSRRDSDGNYINRNYSTHIWNSSSSGTRSILNASGAVYREGSNSAFKYARSVRCLKNTSLINYGIQLTEDGDFYGYAWDSVGAGWISFYGSNYKVTFSDTSGGGATSPGAPIIGSATAGNTQASVSFSAPTSDGGSTITNYTATSNPGGFTGNGLTSPIVVTGLTNGTAYTFTVTATNSVGTGPASLASNSVTPILSKRIFVTSTAYNGNLGGLSGADAKCAARATAVGLTGTWKAWISSGATDITDARDRLVQSSSPYANMNGDRVANNWADLVDGSLLAAIQYNESGVLIAGQAWTGSNSDGTHYFSQDCSASGAGWTSSTGTGGDAGLAGTVTSLTGTWSNAGANSCSSSLSLYCVEQ